MDIIIERSCSNETELIQNALNEVFLSGGGTVIIKQGLYNIGSIRVRSNTTLLLKSGAVLKGTRVPDDYDILEYDKIEPLYGDDLKKVEYSWSENFQTEDGWLSGPCSRWNHALIRVFKAENVKIVGEKGAVIDGSDCYDPLGEQQFRGPHGISLFRSKNVVCKGYTIQNTGNWAHICTNSRDLHFEDITVLGGHDGIHLQATDNVIIDNCEFYTGDDCVAGIDNNNVIVKKCVMNTACSAFRFGGTDILVEKCKMFGPGRYAIRGRLSIEDKINGTAFSKTSRKNMLSVYTYYADYTFPIRLQPGNIRFIDCECDTIDRFVNYDYSGNNRWQCNRPLSSLFFENISLKNIRIPLFLYGDKDVPIRFSLKDADISFVENVDALIYACNCEELNISDLTIKGVNGPLVKSWGNIGKVSAENVSGADNSIVETDEKWDFQVI